MSSFLISGDSWGCGEWGCTGPDRYGVLHTGLQYYLDEIGHYTKNVSKGSISNRDSINRLKNELQIKSDYDYIIWFQSDPLRDLRPYDKSEFATFNTINEMLVSANRLLSASYTTLNDIGIPIHCIGGCSKVDTELIKNFKNLNPLITSALELIVKDHLHSPITFSDWIRNISRDFQDLDELVVIKQAQDKFFDDNEIYFYPDGVHANRLGHEIIFHKICDTLNIDKKVLL